MRTVRTEKGAFCLAAALAALAGVVGVARAQTPLPPRADQSVYDLARVMQPEDEQAIEVVNRELYQKTGVAIVVLTVPQLQDETIDELAVRLGQEWGIGGEGQDRGLVIAFAEEERRIFVATGYGTEGYLPDGRVGALLDQHAIPYLRANRFSEGLAGLSMALAAASAEEYGATLTGVATGAARAPPAPPGPFQIVIGIIALIGLAYLAIRHPALFFMLLLSFGRGGRGGSGFGGGGGGFGGGGGGFG
nr:TPM domain-containing protein [Myxococcota bacterium]